MLSGLPRTEIALYLVLWIGGVSVVLYKLFDKSAAIRATETRLITVSEGNFYTSHLYERVMKCMKRLGSGPDGRRMVMVEGHHADLLQ